MSKSDFLVIATALTGVIMMGSCNDKDDIHEIESHPVRFTAAIAQPALLQGAPITKAAGNQWDPGDEIGIFMLQHGTIKVEEFTENRRYSTTGDGNFTSKDGNEIFYPNSRDKVDFIAYYPFAGNVQVDGTLDVDVSGIQTSATQAATDLLWAHADNSGNGYIRDTNNAVALSFNHKLAKLVMKCKAASNVGISSFDGVKVNINGMKTKNTLSLSDGKLGTPEVTAVVIPRKQAAPEPGFGAVYDAIVLPATYAANMITVDFIISGGDKFTWKVPASIFQGGNEYIYEITLNRTGVHFTSTIVPWNMIDRGQMEANESN